MDGRVLSFLFLFISENNFAMILEKFTAHQHCKNYILYKFERYSSFLARSNLECAQHCSNDINCISYNYLPDSLHCHLNKGIIDGSCINGVFAPKSFYFEILNRIPVCLNDGVWNTGTQQCDCIDGYIGSKCERLMIDCEEGEPYYTGQTKFFYIFPPAAPDPFEIKCNMQWGIRNILMQHYNPLESFNRSWQKYKDGFIDNIKDNFWLGLDKMYYLIQARQRGIYVEIRTGSNYYTNAYDDFRIGNESTGYILMNLGNVIQMGSDPCLPDLLGSAFSAYDHDQDQNPTTNCAADFGVGWWFNSQCAKCNPLGKMNNPSGGNWNGDNSFAFWQGHNWSPNGVKIWFQTI